MTKDPVGLFNEILTRAERTDTEFANAAALATADARGLPAVRMVLVKEVNRDGFVFFTSLESRKARELIERPVAALCFWWPAIQTQVRVEGTVVQVSEMEADKYFATRPRGSQISAWASKQSAVLKSRNALIEQFEDVTRRFDGRSVPRPPHWSGFRVKARTIEFWYGKLDRLHDRHLYSKQGDRWVTSMLQP